MSQQTAPARPLTWGPRRLPVPFVAKWSGEEVVVGGALRARPDGGGLAYRDEARGDRDRHGVLWARVTEAPGDGRPDFRVMHPVRQRRAFLERLCQVCGGPADRDAKGRLFVLRRPTAAEAVSGWPEGLLCTKPPVCVPCADTAARLCPHLDEPVFVRVRKPRVWGVFGGFFLPRSGGGLAAGEDDYLPYGHRQAPLFLANQLVAELTRVVRVSGP
ncbi:hypothetical protein [Streptomyces hoynatensis]|uniref:Uncharacterized protein n=1 Tax=Streptomyces hoynatensis TaxID=1141874 RepID=A0A3A9YTY0_9ACTN|nr:hypothetical protein [Streptomyces hoynatensis]RKN39503.1 hypothetical protein D7294_21165 [Streptomyces hoynatensis]